MTFTCQRWLVVAASKIVVVAMRVDIDRRRRHIAAIWVKITGFFHRAIEATVNRFNIVVVGAITN